jgi:transcriptional regulator with XRE-family HTH domain
MSTVSVDTPSVRNLRENLCEIMETIGLSQGQVAEKAHISRVHLNRILQAKVVPSLDLLDPLAEALGCDVSRLLREPKESPRKKLSKAS